MKKTTLAAVVAILNNVDFENKEELMDELNAELNKDAERKAEKSAEYVTAWEVVKEVLASTTAPLTATEVWEECASNLPSGFTRGRVQYGLNNYWADMLVKVGGKVNTYRLK